MTSLAWHIFEILINFIEVGGGLFFAWCWVKSNPYAPFFSAVSMIFIVIGTSWLSLYGFFDIRLMPDIVPLIASVFLYALFVLKTKWDIAITCSMLNLIILGIITYAVDGFFSTIFLIPYGSLVAQELPRLMTMILAHLLWALVWICIIRWFQPFASFTLITKGRWLIAMVPLFTIILIAVLLEYARAVPAAANNISPMTSMSIGIGLLLLNMGALYLYNQMAKQAQEAVLLQAQKQVGEMALQYKAELEELTKEMRHFRHDFRNHIYTLQGFVDTENYIALQKYLTEIGGEMQRFSKQISTGNQVLDSLINGNMNLAKEKGINVTVQGSVPKKLPISDQHLCILIGNLFTNAYEACQKIEAGEPRFIRIQVYTQRNHLLITMANSTDGAERKRDGKWVTTKADPQNHGFGLLSIDMLVKQYHGYCDRKHENRIFFTTIVLPLVELI